MDQNRDSGRDESQHGTSAEPGLTGGEAQESAAQRRRGGGGATRDYAERMNALDAAGTVEAPHDRKAGARRGDDASKDRRESGDTGMDQPRGR